MNFQEAYRDFLEGALETHALVVGCGLDPHPVWPHMISLPPCAGSLILFIAEYRDFLENDDEEEFF